MFILPDIQTEQEDMSLQNTLKPARSFMCIQTTDKTSNDEEDEQEELVISRETILFENEDNEVVLGVVDKVSCILSSFSYNNKCP